MTVNAFVVSISAVVAILLFFVLYKTYVTRTLDFVAIYGLEESASVVVGYLRNCKRFRAVAGELHYAFWDNEEFICSLEQALRNGCDVVIAFGNALYWNTERIFRLGIKYSNFKFLFLDEREDRHFKLMYYDNETVGIVDKPHSIKEAKRVGILVKNLACHKRLQGLLEKRFESLYSKGEILSVPELFERLEKLTEVDEKKGIYRGFIRRKEDDRPEIEALEPNIIKSLKPRFLDV